MQQSLEKQSQVELKRTSVSLCNGIDDVQEGKLIIEKDNRTHPLEEVLSRLRFIY